MAPPRQASGVRLAFVDDDSGFFTVLDRRLEALGWERSAFAYTVVPDQLAAMKLHAVIVNPSITGPDYLEWVGDELPGLSLLARIEAVLRRRLAGELPTTEETILAGELAIRPDRFDAYAHERPASLSRKEYELLHLLATAGGRVLEREEIYQSVWGYTMARGDRSVDVFVRKLRHKLEVISPGRRYVHTHFGVGYRFAAENPDGAVAAPSAVAAEDAAGSGRRRRTLLV